MFIGSRASFVISLYVLMFAIGFFAVRISFSLSRGLETEAIDFVLRVPTVGLIIYCYVWILMLIWPDIKILYYITVFFTLLGVLWFWCIALSMWFQTFALEKILASDLSSLAREIYTEIFNDRLALLVFSCIFFFIGIFNLLCLVNKN